MIIYLILNAAIFISILYLPIHVILALLIIFFIIYTILTASIKKSIKRIIYIIPYFISVFILQAMASRGQTYKIANLYLDKKGVDITIDYFLRILAVLYFLGIVFILSKNIRIPKNKFGIEIIRITIFFNIIKRNFFKNIKKIRSNKLSFKEKLTLIKYIIGNVYTDTFKYYPYDKYINHYYNSLD